MVRQAREVRRRDLEDVLIDHRHAPDDHALEYHEHPHIMPTPLTSPIKAPERIEQPAARGGAQGSARRFALPLDPLLTLAVVGLGSPR